MQLIQFRVNPGLLPLWSALTYQSLNQSLAEVLIRAHAIGVGMTDCKLPGNSLMTPRPRSPPSRAREKSPRRASRRIQHSDRRDVAARAPSYKPA